MITYNIYIVIRETGQFSSKGIINDFIGNLHMNTSIHTFTRCRKRESEERIRLRE